jgi:hypothetical protein
MIPELLFRADPENNSPQEFIKIDVELPEYPNPEANPDQTNLLLCGKAGRQYNTATIIIKADLFFFILTSLILHLQV